MKEPLSVALLLVAFCQTLRAAEIAEPLYCVVQELESIVVVTGKTDSVEREKIDPRKPIKVEYRPQRNGKVVEIYGKDSDIEKISEYERAYSAGGTQYLSTTNPNHAITYFGKSDEGYHIIVKYMRMLRNDGGIDRGWRTDSYLNAFMYCADSKKM